MIGEAKSFSGELRSTGKNAFRAGTVDSGSSRQIRTIVPVLDTKEGRSPVSSDLPKRPVRAIDSDLKKKLPQIGTQTTTEGTETDAGTKDPNQLFQDVLEEAGKKGIDEELLQRMTYALSTNDTPFASRASLIYFGKRTGLAPADVQDLTRRYAKEKVRANERGPLYHYHQRSHQEFERVADEGAILSADSLKELGRAPQSVGSRPDVVLMTRDSYNKEGKLIKPGLTNVGVPADVAVVYDASIMDSSGYDCVGMYPSLPRIPLAQAHAVLVQNEEAISHTQQVLQSHNLQIPVMTRQAWSNRT